MNKILLTGIISALFLVCFSNSSSIFAQEDHSSETIHGMTAIELEMWVGVAHWLTGIGTVVLAIALIRTFHHMRAVKGFYRIYLSNNYF